MAHYVDVYEGGAGFEAKFVRCRVVESLGFVHDVGRRVKVVLFEGKETTVMLRGGLWQRHTPRERVQPLADAIAANWRRKAREEDRVDPA
jgi:hypothetical protein